MVESEVGVVEHERGGVSPATSHIFLIRRQREPSHESLAKLGTHLHSLAANVLSLLCYTHTPDMSECSAWLPPMKCLEQ